jgi:hypothetical protein
MNYQVEISKDRGPRTTGQGLSVVSRVKFVLILKQSTRTVVIEGYKHTLSKDYFR